MKIERKFLNSGMDTDSTDEVRDQNDLIRMFNGRSLGTDLNESGTVTSIEGNRIIPHSIPSGNNLCIGAKAFDLLNKAYYFLWNENLHHRIEEYNSESDTVFTVFENIRDSGGVDILGWSSSSFIKDIELIDGRHLKFNDAVRSPKEIDIQRVKDNEYIVVTETDIEQIKEQPMIPIKAEYISDRSRNSNSMARRLFQYKYQYKYWNDEESANSEYSKRPVPVDEATPAKASDVRSNNGHKVTLVNGSNRVKEVIVLVRYDELSWRIIKRISYSDILAVSNTEIDIPGQVYESYNPTTKEYSFIFYNDGVNDIEDSRVADLMYDYLPERANAMELANGNSMLFAGIDEGDSRPKVGVNVGVSYYDPQISITPTDLSNILTVERINEYRISGSHRRRVEIWLTGIPRVGDEITITSRSMKDGSVKTEKVSTVTEDGNISKVAMDMVSGLYKANYSGNLGQFTTESYWVYNSVTFKYANKISGESRSIPVVKSNSSYLMVPSYRKKFGRLIPLQNGIVLNTKSLAQTSGLLAQFNWEIKDLKAPVGAVDYQWLITKNGTHQRYLQINAGYNGVVDQNYIELSFKSLIKFNRKNPTSQLTYDYSPGDRITFLSIYDSSGDPIWFNKTPIDVEVLSFKSVPSSESDPTATDFVMRIRRPEGISDDNKYESIDLSGKEIVVEVYTPLGIKDDKTTQLYYEVGEVYPIDSNGNHTVMSGTLKEADAYFKTREMEFSSLDNKFSVFEMEDANFSDFYKSNYYSYGRPRSYYDTPEKVYLKAAVRFSDYFNKFTGNNGLNRFFNENIEMYDEVYGAIWYLEQRDNMVISVQEVKVGYIPILQSIIEDQAGQSNIAVSDKLLNAIRYSKGINIGIGSAIRSYVSYGSYLYFIDPSRCEPIRVGLDGVVSISKKMSKFFKKAIRNAFKAGRDIKSWYDVYNNECVFSFTSVDEKVINIPINEANWRVIDSYVVDPSQLNVGSIQNNGSATYDSSTGVATFRPTSGFNGAAGIKFTFISDGQTIERGECIDVIPGETVLDPISFMDQSGVPLDTIIVSNYAEISGINTPQQISVTHGEIQVNDGDWASGPVIVIDGDVIRVRIMSSSLFESTTYAEIIANGSPVRFNVKTKRDDVYDFEWVEDESSRYCETEDIVINEFDYLVARFMWDYPSAGRDLDIQVQYENTGMPELDPPGRFVGYGGGSDTQPSGFLPKDKSFLWWGLDDTNASANPIGTEGVLVGLKAIRDAYPSLPNIIEVGLYAVWYNAVASGDFKFEVVTYKGGTMSVSGTNIINTGGVVVSSDTRDLNTSIQNNTHTPANSYRVGVLKYNKTTDQANLILG